MAGGLTIVGGALTIATAGAAALPILLTGTALGLTAGLTGGAAAIADKVIKSNQMKEAEEAIQRDQELSQHLEETVTSLQKNEFVKRQIAQQAVVSGAGAAANSAQIANLVTGTVAGGLGKVGAEAAAKIFGEDIGKEVNTKLLNVNETYFNEFLGIKSSPAHFRTNLLWDSHRRSWRGHHALRHLQA